MPKAPVLLLADAIAEPELGSSEKPTVGSAGHRLGACKPCAFYHTKGCGNGWSVAFVTCARQEKRSAVRKKSLPRSVRRTTRSFGFD
jgi:hypothetical protein